MSTLNDCLRSLFALLLLMNDPKNAYAFFLRAPLIVIIFTQIDDNQVLALNPDDFDDNILVMQYHLRRFLPMVPRLKNYETNRHHTHLLRHPQPNHRLVTIEPGREIVLSLKNNNATLLQVEVL